MKENDGFEHNQQSLRIVDILESKYPNFPGLNLSFEVGKGFKNTNNSLNSSDKVNGPFISLEAQIVNLADEITYTAHDVDDAIRAKILTDEDLVQNVSIWRRYSNEILSEYANLSDKQYTYLMNSKLITNQIRKCNKNIKRKNSSIRYYVIL